MKSSGNQAEGAQGVTAKWSQVEYPKVNEIVKNDIYVDDCTSIVKNDIYVDDCTSGYQSKREALKRADKLEVVLNIGGFVFQIKIHQNHCLMMVKA